MARNTWTTELDSELLEASRGGDNGAYAVLWERHHRAGLTAARSIAPRLDANDLVSESYLRILELVQDGRGPTGAFRPYLYRVIRTVASDTYRPNEDTSDRLEDIPDLTEAGPWEDGAFDRNSAAQAFAGLSERWQSVLWYTVVEGLPPREAAVLLGMSANGVSALAIRAREALQSGWVEAHVDRALADATCQFTLEHLQRYQRGKLTAAVNREVELHLDTCETCPKALAEYTTLNTQLALVLASLFVGGGTATALLGGFGQAAPAAAATGLAAGAAGSGAAGSGAAGAAGSSSAGGLGAGGSTLVGVLTGPAALIAGAAVAAVAVIAGGAIVVSNMLGGGGAAPPAAESATSETLAPSDTTSGQEADTPAVTKPATAKPRPEKTAVDTPETPAVPAPAPDNGTTPIPPVVPTPEPTTDPTPTPQPTPKPTPTPTPEPEPESPVVDLTLLPGAATCNTSQSGVSGTFLYGFANRSLESASLRVIQTAGATPVTLPESSVKRWGYLWVTSSVTPLSQWPGLNDTPTLTATTNPAILEIQVTDLEGKVSPWTKLELGNCAPTP